MKPKLLTILMSGIILVGASTTILGQDSGQLEPPYGPKLMTQQELQEHRKKMQNLQTQEERYTYMKKIHEQMRQRALEKGLKIPNQPPAWKRGEGMGSTGSGKRKKN